MGVHLRAEMIRKNAKLIRILYYFLLFVRHQYMNSASGKTRACLSKLVPPNI